MARIDLPSLQALSNAASFGQPTLVLHVSPEEAEANRFQAAWGRWGVHVPLAVVASPYRAVVGPIVNYLEELHAQRPDLTLTVVVPEIKVKRRCTTSCTTASVSGCDERTSVTKASP